MWYIVAAVVVLVVVLILVAGLPASPLRRWSERRRLERATQLFRRQREHLEARFFDLARQSGKPRGLEWIGCDWFDGVTFATDKQSGLLTAFVSVNIRFEAVEGGDMEGVAAVSNIRDAAAVFHFDGAGWGTGGRALFNMNAEEAPVRLQGQYDPVKVDG
jgi:hypothetical protein